MNKIDLKNIEMIDALASRRSCSQGGIDYYRNGAMEIGESELCENWYNTTIGNLEQ